MSGAVKSKRRGLDLGWSAVARSFLPLSLSQRVPTFLKVASDHSLHEEPEGESPPTAFRMELVPPEPGGDLRVGPPCRDGCFFPFGDDHGHPDVFCGEWDRRVAERLVPKGNGPRRRLREEARVGHSPPFVFWREVVPPLFVADHPDECGLPVVVSGGLQQRLQKAAADVGVEDPDLSALALDD